MTFADVVKYNFCQRYLNALASSYADILNFFLHINGNGAKIVSLTLQWLSLFQQDIVYHNTN